MNLRYLAVPALALLTGCAGTLQGAAPLAGLTQGYNAAVFGQPLSLYQPYSYSQSLQDSANWSTIEANNRLMMPQIQPIQPLPLPQMQPMPMLPLTNY